jgi:hypothetical protein
MNKLIKSIALGFLFWMLLYIIFAFSAFEINPGLWSDGVPVIFGLLSIGLFIFAFLLTYNDLI